MKWNGVEWSGDILSVKKGALALLVLGMGIIILLSEPREVLHSIAQNHILIGAMYIDGVGKEKDLTQGMEHFQKALEMDPSLIDVHYSLGVAYLEKREWSQAGLAYQRMGDQAKAREAFEQAVHFNP